MRRFGWILITTTALTGLAGSPAFSNPTGGVVSGGSASIASSGSTLTVTQSSSKAVIDWRTFNIAQNETTNFLQPSVSSIALNRVGDINPSTIAGNLNANGHIILINPNGVLFTGTAQVDVGGITATTANIANSDFMAGNFKFSQPGSPTGAIVNQGTITVEQAGLASLVAPQVENDGVITAKLGKINLASGDVFTLDLAGDGKLQVAVSASQLPQQLVANNGMLSANGGTIRLTAAAARTLVNSLIVNTGVIQATALNGHQGRVTLYAEGSNAVRHNVAANKGQKSGTSTVVDSGIIDVSSSSCGASAGAGSCATSGGPAQPGGSQDDGVGGSISILGDNVGIMSGSFIDASGNAGGGTIKIGGDFHGAGTTPTALNTYVDANALIMANANTSGNGGNVAVWSDGNTWFSGNIMAEGGKNSGNGGFVETSGHGYLDANGYVDLMATGGQKGTYLLDPTNISIYGNFTPAYTETIQGDGSTLASALQLWLDASDTSKVTLTYETTGTTATGSSGANTITVGSNSGLVVGERVQIGGSSDSYAASVNDNTGDGVYTITNISGTTITLDANLGSSYAGATLYGGFVSQWNDKSGNGYNMTPIASGPLFLANSQNGLSVLNFNGVNENLTSASFTLNTPISLFLNYRRLGQGTTSTTYVTPFDGVNNNTYNVGYSDSANPGSIGLYPQDWNNGNEISVPELTSKSWFLYTTAGDGSSGIQYINGGESSHSFGGYSGSLGGIRLFAGDSNGETPFGQMSEVIIYGAKVSTNAQALVNQYQSAKWGIALVGPGNATGESGLTGTEAQQAMASTQAGATTDGYSVFTTSYLNRLSQTSNIILDASNNINLDFQGDTLTVAAGKNITLTAGNSISNVSAGTLTTSQSGGSGGNVTMSAGADIALANFTVNTNGGNIILDADTAGSGGAISLGDGTHATALNSSGGNITLGGNEANPASIAAGTGYATGDANVLNANGGGDGIYIRGATINAGAGNIIANGQGWNNAGSIVNAGVDIYNSGVLETTSGNITINGVGNTGAGFDAGVLLRSASTIATATGSIAVTGTAASGTAGNNGGVYIQSSTISSTGSGTISLTGIAGTGGSNNYGIYSDTAVATIGGASDTGNITLSTDSIYFSAAPSIQTTGNVTFEPHTASTTIGVAGGTGTLQITSGAGSILANTTAGAIVIGNTSDSGAMNIAADSAWTTPVSFITGNSGSITVAGAQSGANSFTFTGPTTLDASVTSTGSGTGITFNSAVTLGANDTITTSNGAVDFASTVDGTSSGSQGLTVSAGNTGSATFTGEVGSNTPLGALSVTAGGGINLNAVTASSINLNSSGGSGNIASNNSGILDATSGAITVNSGGDVDFANIGMVTSNQNVSVTAAGDASLNAINSGTGSLTVNANNVYLYGGGLASPTSLVGYWNFNEGSGTTATDDSGSGNTGTINGATYSSTVPGALGSGDSLSFNGTSNYVSVSGTQFQSLSTGSVSIWLNTSNTTGGDAWGTLTNSSNNRQFNVTAAANGAVGVTAVNASGTILFVAHTNNTFATGWHNIVYTSVNGSGAFNLYVDGALQAVTYTAGASASAFFATTMNSGDNLQIGAKSDGSNTHIGYFPGLIDDTRIYNTALSAQDVANLYAGIPQWSVGTANITATNNITTDIMGATLTAGAGKNITMTAGGSIVNSSIGTVSASQSGGTGGDVTLATNALNFAANPAITTNGIVTIEPDTASTTVGVAGGAGSLAITSAILGDLTAGSIVIGNTADTGLLTADAYSWGEPVTLLSGSGGITLAGVQTMGASSFFAQTASTGDITLGASGGVTSTATGTPITLASAHNFINNNGSGALSASSGRWLVYSTNPSNDTDGSLANSFRRFSCTYGGSCPALGSGNGFLYSETPTLTATPVAASATYGTAPAYSYSLSGYLGSDSGSDSITGAASYSTNATTSGSGHLNAGIWNITDTAGTLSSAMGYGFTGATLNNGLTVNAKGLAVTADDKSMNAGATVPTLTYGYSGLASGDASASFSGALATTGSSGSAAGNYGINIGTLAATGNYTIGTFNAGVFTINSVAPATSTTDISRILQQPRFIVANQSLMQAPVELVSLAGGESGATPLGVAPASPAVAGNGTSPKHSRRDKECDGKPCETD